MDFRLSDVAEAFRLEVCSWLDENLTPEVIEHEERTGDGFHPETHRALARKGWVAASWPKEFGGQERDAFEMYVMEEEFLKAGFPRNTGMTTSLVGNTLRVVGTERQKQEFLPGIVAGEVTIALGYTEPHCGSDIADARTRAVRDGDDWILNGQKMFTTGSHLTSHVFVLARTDTDKPKHRGLTLFLVRTDSEGFEAQPVHTLSGERTNLTFYADVRVPDWLRVGEVDGGWDVMKVALGLEQGIGYSSAAVKMLERAVEWARESGRIDDPLARERLARTAVQTEVGKLLERRSMWAGEMGHPSARVAGPMAKLYTSEKLIADTSDVMDLLGPEALAHGGGPDAPGGAALEYYQRYAQGTTIYAGSSEIMRSQIAEVGLGLPRSRSR